MNGSQNVIKYNFQMLLIFTSLAAQKCFSLQNVESVQLNFLRLFNRVLLDYQ